MISQHLPFRIPGVGHIDLTLTYDPTDPYAVTTTFHGTTTDATWLMSRDVLYEAARSVHADSHHGAGDVHAWADGDRIRIGLYSPDGMLVGEVDRHRLLSFLADTIHTVPRGREHEHLDIDAILGRILQEAAS